MSPAPSAELLERAREGDQDACEKAITENAGLIWSVVRRYYGRGVEPDDLYQLGCLGFLKALRGFEQDYGTQFSTYAVPKIAGEIRRFLRDDGLVKVSSPLKERAAAILRMKASGLSLDWLKAFSIPQLTACCDRMDAATGISTTDKTLQLEGC